MVQNATSHFGPACGLRAWKIHRKNVAKKYCSMHGVLLLTMIRYDMTICLDNGRSTLYV